MRTLLLRLLQYLPWLIAALLLVALVLAVPAFQRLAYWRSLAPQYFAVAALALALTPIVLTGGIDLSIGSMTVLASITIGYVWRDLGMPLGVALAAGVAVGILCGLGNGLLVSLGVLPLVATLATRELYRGVAWLLAGDNPVTQFPPALTLVWNRPLLGVPLALVGLLILLGITYLVVHHTWVGRMLFALGDNAEAVRFAALPTRGVQIGLYAWAGLVAGLCGLGLVLKYGAAKADAERSLELLAIACVVMGGIRVTGGSGHVLGTLLGILTVCTLLAGLTQMASTWRDTAMGGILVAVALADEAGARWLARLQGSRR
ncbi:MAG: ABC transporter permease [Gemmataceae bacterium]